jgi:hypothetical protein
MAVIGWLATIALGIVVLAVILFAVSALPDFNRYRRLRRM